MTLRRSMIFYIVTLMVVTIVLIALSSCRPTGGVTPADATATFGAEQFHIQLTAQAEGMTP